MTKLSYARIAYTLGGKTDELASGFSDTNYQCWSSRNQRLRDIFGIQDNFNLEQTLTNMTSRRQIKSLSVTSDPITAGLSQEMNVLLDNNHIADAQTYCHMFLDCHKLYLAISPSILQKFSQSQCLRKVLEKTFQLMPVMSWGNQYWLRY